MGDSAMNTETKNDGVAWLGRWDGIWEYLWEGNEYHKNIVWNSQQINKNII